MASQRRAAPPRGRRPRGSPRHMGRGSGRSEPGMAVPPGRCPDCWETERGGGGGGSRGVPGVLHLGVLVDEGDVLPGALRLMRELRPSWEPARVKTKVRGVHEGGPVGAVVGCTAGAVGPDVDGMTHRCPVLPGAEQVCKALTRPLPPPQALGTP